jgi:hypothetical protein
VAAACAAMVTKIEYHTTNVAKPKIASTTPEIIAPGTNETFPRAARRSSRHRRGSNAITGPTMNVSNKREPCHQDNASAETEGRNRKARAPSSKRESMLAALLQLKTAANVGVTSRQHLAHI